LLQDGNARILLLIAAEYFRRGISRTIVNKDDFNIFQGLAKDTVQAAPDIFFLVVNRYNN
jgi:malate/lactate dehydrogenase